MTRVVTRDGAGSNRFYWRSTFNENKNKITKRSKKCWSIKWLGRMEIYGREKKQNLFLCLLKKYCNRFDGNNKLTDEKKHRLLTNKD